MIGNILQLLELVKNTCKQWQIKTAPWFRGEPESSTPLLPRLFREDGNELDENLLVQRFRSMGPTYSSGLPIPVREHNDQWLYIMQHVGVPTRLLDWTEGLLQALFFALENPKPILWILDPQQLNSLSGFKHEDHRQLPIPWGNENSPAYRNIQAAFRSGSGAKEYPVAFLPTYIHPRMAAQRCTFTVHGSLKVSIASIDGFDRVRKYDIDPNNRNSLISDLRLLGISKRSLFPDYDGLGKDLLP